MSYYVAREDGAIDSQPVNLTIKNVRLPHDDKRQRDKLWKVRCQGGRVSSVTEMLEPEDVELGSIDADRSLMIPSLCHSHIHLDKCFILDRSELKTGDFAEAMSVTAAVKSRFKDEPKEDLYARGYRLIRESVACGVTAMRAHVEVDSMVRFVCLEAAQRLQHTFRGVCDIQIAVFAQEPLFTGFLKHHEPNSNYRALEQACALPGVTVVGSAPYVETSTEKSKSNIAHILELAKRHALHVDFHLDYNLDPDSEPLIYEVIQQMRQDSRYLDNVSRARVTLGHCTRLQLFSEPQWLDLAELMEGLPITLVSLPQSDIYMMGRENQGRLGAPRGTLQVPKLTKYGLQVAMSVNNVQNAFTPQGSVDPLSLCSFGAAIFQSATTNDLKTLLRSVTLTSKAAIGISDTHRDLFPSRGDPADFVILTGIRSLQNAVLNPGYERITIRAGTLVSSRLSAQWTSLDNWGGKKRECENNLDVAPVPWRKRIKEWCYVLKWATGKAKGTDRDNSHSQDGNGTDSSSSSSSQSTGIQLLPDEYATTKIPEGAVRTLLPSPDRMYIIRPGGGLVSGTVQGGVHTKSPDLQLKKHSPLPPLPGSPTAATLTGGLDEEIVEAPGSSAGAQLKEEEEGRKASPHPPIRPRQESTRTRTRSTTTHTDPIPRVATLAPRDRKISTNSGKKLQVVPKSDLKKSTSLSTSTKAPTRPTPSSSPQNSKPVPPSSSATRSTSTSTNTRSMHSASQTDPLRRGAPRERQMSTASRYHASPPGESVPSDSGSGSRDKKISTRSLGGNHATRETIASPGSRDRKLSAVTAADRPSGSSRSRRPPPKVRAGVSFRSEEDDYA